PTVTVLVAARNEEASIGKLLDSLLLQDYPAELCEYIVIDDGSTDRTAERVSEFSTKHDHIRLLSLQDDPSRTMGPKKRALTAGVEASQGSIILITDADCEVQPGWISGMAAEFGEDVQAVSGRVRFQQPVGFWGRLAAFEGVVNAVLNAAVINSGGALSCSGANFAYRRSVFTSLGGYDKDRKSISGDDDLLLQKIRSSKGRIRFNNRLESTVSTSGPVAATSYWSRKRRHLSAGSRYAPHWILLAAVIYTGLTLTVTLTIADAAGWITSASQAMIWLIYSSSLYLIFLRGIHYLQERQWRIWGLITSFLFPLIFTIIQPLTLFPAPRWKGRKV
ncbi:glycosyltransferase, partial [bacterium]|nr:glycosyltransferase [bacterium]